MKKILPLALLTAIAFTLPVQAAQPTPQPKILVIDRAALLKFSKVGQDIDRQAQAYSIQARNELEGRAQALRKEGATLEQQAAILAADAKAKKLRDFQARQASLQTDAQKKEAMIQGGYLQARNAVATALNPVLQQIMKERGANMLLDKQAVVFATDNSFDITGDAVNRLNQKMSSIKMTLVAPPAAPPQK